MTDLTPSAFEIELKALLKKYKAEMSAREVTRNWETWADGIDVDFEGIYDADGETIRSFQRLNYPVM